MSTQLQNFHKHRTTLNGQSLEVYYQLRPNAKTDRDKVSLYDILDSDTRSHVRSIAGADLDSIKDEIWGR